MTQIMEKVMDFVFNLIGDFLHFKSSIAVRNNEEAAEELLNWTRNNAAHKRLSNGAVYLEIAVSIRLTFVAKPVWDVRFKMNNGIYGLNLN